MNQEIKEIKEVDQSKWMSTYGLLTAESILETLNIHLPHNELVDAIKSEDSRYHLLLQVPLKHIFNGIILEQAKDYQIYAQKTFIDFLMSGQNDQPEDAPGASVRESLDEERESLQVMGESFEKLQLEHKRLIAKSQTTLKTIAEPFKKRSLDDIQQILQSYESELSSLSNQADDMTYSLRDFRRQFYELTLRVSDLMKLLPEYHQDEQRSSEHLELIDFDRGLGEDSES